MPVYIETRHSDFRGNVDTKWRFGFVKGLSGPESVMATRYDNLAALIMPNAADTTEESLFIEMQKLKIYLGKNQKRLSAGIRIENTVEGPIIYGDIIGLLQLQARLGLKDKPTSIPGLPIAAGDALQAIIILNRIKISIKSGLG